MRVGDLVYLRDEEFEVGIILSQRIWPERPFSHPIREVWWPDGETSTEVEEHLELISETG